jgi:hypothetical protein
MINWTVGDIITLVKDTLNEPDTTSLTATEFLALVNDGYNDVATKGQCYERRITLNNIASGQSFINLYSYYVFKVNYVEYYTANKGIVCVLPNAIGYMGIPDNTPQYWFQWGNVLVVEPLPDVSTYELYVYASCYPPSAITLTTSTLDYLPEEFHECVFDYVLAFACLKLKRWGDFVFFYNKYIETLQIKKAEYIKNAPDMRVYHMVPDNVVVK